MIGLCLKYEQVNYGSKLQALATIRLMDKLGIKYKIIHYEKAGLWFKLKSLPRIFNATFRQDKFEDYSRKRAIRRHPEISTQLTLRRRMFKQFDREYFDIYEIKGRYYRDIQRIASEMEAVVSCSDQLWSPAGLGTNFYNLMFVPDKVKKISFASSFGVSSIPWYQKKATAKYLSRIDYVSCRENRGAEIVKELTGREVPVLMDPVFAFDNYEWEEIIPIERIYKEPYIFCYLLGNNPNHRILAEKFAKEERLKIITIKHLDQYVDCDEYFGDYSPYDANPTQFLNILRMAEYVITDSFHGCAFSIIMKKKFVVFDRYSSSSSSSKNSRIESVCFNLGLTERRVKEMGNISNIITKPIDWDKVEEKQKIYKSRMWSYLKDALK